MASRFNCEYRGGQDQQQKTVPGEKKKHRCNLCHLVIINYNMY